jgi:glycosyltransferase involved in cell wall biosynthesis
MIIVLMAAYNEEAALGHVLERMPDKVHGLAVRTVVLSDGSTDGTADVARAAGVEVIEFEQNRGKGAVLKSGLISIAGDPCSALVFMDADGQHDPEQLDALVTPVLDGSADVVVGSRYMLDAGRGNAPWNRYAVRQAIQMALGLLLTTSVTDPFSGYRCLGPDAQRCIELTGDRYESELEMLFCAERHALKVSEIAIPKVYGQGFSKMGVRFGSILGRVDVVSRYVFTIIRESIRSRTAGTPKERVSA